MMSCAHGPERGNVELGFIIEAWHRTNRAALLEGLKDWLESVLGALFGILIELFAKQLKDYAAADTIFKLAHHIQRPPIRPERLGGFLVALKFFSMAAKTVVKEVTISCEVCGISLPVMKRCSRCKKSPAFYVSAVIEGLDFLRTELKFYFPVFQGLPKNRLAAPSF